MVLLPLVGDESAGGETDVDVLLEVDGMVEGMVVLDVELEMIVGDVIDDAVEIELERVDDGIVVAEDVEVAEGGKLVVVEVVVKLTVGKVVGEVGKVVGDDGKVVLVEGDVEVDVDVGRVNEVDDGRLVVDVDDGKGVMDEDDGEVEVDDRRVNEVDDGRMVVDVSDVEVGVDGGRMADVVDERIVFVDDKDGPAVVEVGNVLRLGVGTLEAELEKVVLKTVCTALIVGVDLGVALEVNPVLEGLTDGVVLGEMKVVLDENCGVVRVPPAWLELVGTVGVNRVEEEIEELRSMLDGVVRELPGVLRIVTVPGVVRNEKDPGVVRFATEATGVVRFTMEPAGVERIETATGVVRFNKEPAGVVRIENEPTGVVRIENEPAGVERIKTDVVEFWPILEGVVREPAGVLRGVILPGVVRKEPPGGVVRTTLDEEPNCCCGVVLLPKLEGGVVRTEKFGVLLEFPVDAVIPCGVERNDTLLTGGVPNLAGVVRAEVAPSPCGVCCPVELTGGV